MKKKFGPHLIAFFFVAIIVILLLNTGSAKAFNLILSVLDNNVQKGENVNFNASIEIEAEDGVVIIDRFILILTGPNNIECSFMPNGTIISQSDCPGITIKKIREAPFGYGYGYNGYTEGLFEYQIELDTSDYTTGLYETKLVLLKDNGEEIMERGEDIRISVVPPEALRGCSLRAVQGIADVNETEYDGKNNRLSFFISRSRSKLISGHGYLTLSQSENKRFEYDFDIDEVIDNSATSATMIVSGKYRVGRGAEQTLNSIITFSKSKKGFVNLTQIPVDGINATNMKISFIQGCNRIK